MIEVYVPDGVKLKRMTLDLSADPVPEETVWIDLSEPSEEEIGKVEALVSARVPSRAEMAEIEISSRLYNDRSAAIMNVPVVHGLHSGNPSFEPVTFMLTKERLVTVRYSDPRSLRIFAARLCGDPSIIGSRKDEKPLPGSASALSPASGADNAAAQILVGLLETIVDRVADLLETVSADLDQIASDIFSSSRSKKPTGTPEFKKILQRIGASGDIASRVRESLAVFDRMTPFLQLSMDGRGKGLGSLGRRLKVMARDVRSLNDFCAFLSNKTTFLLDTTVGMISIEQNGIIKVFSVASVAFLPPTLIASIYGMNFRLMPELDWSFGYPMAIVMMVLSGILPTLYFRMKGWF